jgi:hypothetical protein
LGGWEGERERERDGVSKLDVLTSRSPVANPKSGPDYSVFKTILLFFFFSVLHTLYNVFAYTRLKIASLDYRLWITETEHYMGGKNLNPETLNGNFHIVVLILQVAGYANNHLLVDRSTSLSWKWLFDRTS